MIFTKNYQGKIRLTKTKELISTLYKNIKISSHSGFVPEKSSDIHKQYVFLYRINIENRSKNSIQLLSRYWSIRNGNGEVEDIYGPGVVGKKPIIKPNKIFTYESFCPLATPIGSMSGCFRMTSGSGIQFNTEVKKFTLIASSLLN